jgi:hypothetical protein
MLSFKHTYGLKLSNSNSLNLNMLTAEKKKYTKEDYMALDEGAPFQLINADLVMSPSPTTYHQILTGRLYKLIDSILNGLILEAFVCLRL